VFGRPRSFSTSWNKKSKEILEEIYDIENFRAEAEQCEQCFLSEMAPPHILKWMQKRWEHYITSSNCVAACLLAIILVLVLCIRPSYHWWIVVSISVLIFSVNGQQAWCEVRDMDNFLVRNAKRINNREIAEDREC
jgi:hypothetical protein